LGPERIFIPVDLELEGPEFRGVGCGCGGLDQLGDLALGSGGGIRVIEGPPKLSLEVIRCFDDGPLVSY
jgi:hypothetical protein